MLAMGMSPRASIAGAAAHPPLGAVVGLQDVLVPDPAGGSDYVATLEVERGWGPAGKDVHAVARRGEWVRIDKTEARHRSTSYVGLMTGVWVSVARGQQGQYRFVQIRALDEVAKAGAYELRATHKQESALGEACIVWKGVMSAGIRGASITRLGCVTKDGVELWRRTTSPSGLELSSARATRVERRRVTKAFAEPPGDLLDLQLWNDPPSPATSPAPDFEVVLKRDGPGMGATVRRHYPWVYEDMMGRQRSILANRMDGVASLSVNFGANGAPNSLVFQRYSRPSDPIKSVPINRPPEVILGENCSWFDAMPGVADAGRFECRTQDGVPMKIVTSGRGWETAYIAQKIVRKPLSIAEVLPPADTLDQRLWGLHD
jgi:hypothetical protein